MSTVNQLAVARKSSMPAALCLCALLAACAPALVRAQETKNPERGYTAGGSFALGEVETINTTNGNLMFSFPLATLTTGPSGLSASFNLVYNSKLYDTQVERTLDESGQENLQNFLGDSEWGGWRLSSWFNFEVVNRFDREGSGACNRLESIFIWKLNMIFPDGGRREFRPVNFPSQGGYYDVHPSGAFSGCRGGQTTNTLVYYSTDGSYMRLEFPHVDGPFGWMQNWTLSMPDGSRVVSAGPLRRFYDRNDNYIEVRRVENYNDTGRPATLLVDRFGRSVAQQGVSPTETQIHALGFDNRPVTWRILWKEVFVRKTYRTVAAAGGRERGGTSTQTVEMPFRVVDRVVLPAQAGGLSYVFGYNAGEQDTGEDSHGWGEVSSVTLPSGAHVAYKYRLDGLGTFAALANTERVLRNSPVSKTLTYRAEYDGASAPVTEVWSYNINNSGSCVTSPDGGTTCQQHGNVSYESRTSGLVYRIDRPDGTRVERDWHHNYPLGFDQGDGANPYVRSEFVSVRDAAGVFAKTAVKDFNYDKNGNLTRVREYDWVAYSAVHDAGGNPLWGAARPAARREKVNAYNSPTPDASDSTTASFNAYYNGSAPLLRNAVASSETLEDGLVRARSEFVYDDPTRTGNLLETRSWDDARGPLLALPGGRRLDSTNSISATNSYDQFGNLTLRAEPGRADGSRSQTRYVYGPVEGRHGLYPTEEIAADGTPAARTTRREYDFWTGLVTRTTDADNGVSTAVRYDALGRPILSVAAEGRPEEARTATAYDDALRRVTTRADLRSAGDGLLVSVEHYDQLGRPRLSRRLEDATAQDSADETAGIKVQTRYAQTGTNSLTLTSNPYRAATSAQAGGEATMGWTVSTADNGGRLVRVETFGGEEPPAPWGPNREATGAVTTAYDAEASVVTDQAGRSRRSVADALGRLTQVFEAPHDAGYNYQTSYEYDALGNLTRVRQGRQTRVFLYSSLSRLVSATNPESGTARYEYDPNGNLTRRTDARGVRAVYSYDALNRPTSVDYSDATPDVAYAYDSAPNGKGRLSAVSNGVSVYGYGSYDAHGRVRASSQTVGGVTYSMPDYRYDLAGNLTSAQYPSGRVVATEYDEAGRPAGVRDHSTGHYYAGASAADAGGRLRYAAHGPVAALRLGNGLWEHTHFNSRLQPAEIGLGHAPSDSGLLELGYGYGAAARNNGNVLSQRVRVAGGLDLTQSYDYDPVNRLAGAREAPTAGGDDEWRQSYTYLDPAGLNGQFGNRRVDAGNTTPNVLPRQNPHFNPADNRIISAGYAYDEAGNMLCDPEHPCGQSPGGAAYFVYDAENRMRGAGGGPEGGGARYDYDGQGRRVRKVRGAQVTVFVYDAHGRLAAEYSDGADTDGGADAAGGTSYLTQDHLGSTRAVTDAAGRVRSRYDYLPFGEEIRAGTGGRTQSQGYSQFDGVRQQFTGYEKDDETSLDFAQARYYSNTQGRFTSPDPLLSSARAAVPQSWNRYTYVLNNPLVLTDPSGLDWYFNSKSGEHGTYQWHEKHPGGDWEAVVGNKFTYYAGEGRGWVTLDPYSSNFKEGFASREEAQGLVDTWWSASPTARKVILGDGESVGLNQQAEAGGDLALATLGTGAALGTGVGLGAYATGALAGGGTTLGLGGGGATAASAGEFAIIGELPATANYIGLPNANVLNLGQSWTRVANAAWIDKIIASRMPVMLATPLEKMYRKGELTQYGREAQQLLNAGYRQVGQWLVPPK